MTLEALRAALLEIASQEAKKAQLRAAREHLTQQDVEMFNRIFANIEATEHLTLKERTVTIERTKHDGARSILGMRVEAPPRRRKTVIDPRKKPVVQDGPSVDEVSRLHARLNTLRDSIRGGDGAT